ncbi:MAG TPA: hypothetical protein VGK56_09015, partial [Anaerolineales bacterium]
GFKEEQVFCAIRGCMTIDGLEGRNLAPPLCALASAHRFVTEVNEGTKPKLKSQTISVCKRPVQHSQAVLKNRLLFDQRGNTIDDGHG